MNREKFNLNVVLGAFFGSMCWSITEGEGDDKGECGVVVLHGQEWSFNLVFSEDGIVENFRIERMYKDVNGKVADVEADSSSERDTEEIHGFAPRPWTGKTDDADPDSIEGE